MGLSSLGGPAGQEGQSTPPPLPPTGPLPHSGSESESFPHRTLQRRPGRLMNELYCMGRKERTHSRGQSPPQSSDQSPDGPGAAAGLANPALAEARIPAPGRLLGYSAPGAGEKIKDTEDIGLGDPGIQNSGAGAADSPQRRRLMGRCWNHGGDAHLDRAGGRRVALGGRGRGSHPSDLSRGGDRGRCTSGPPAGVGALT